MGKINILPVYETEWTIVCLDLALPTADCLNFTQL